MAFEYYIRQGAKRLRCGYTTGSCAALAAKASAQLLLGGESGETVTTITPKGLPVTVSVTEITTGSEWVRCGVRKDGGDDCDATDGAMIYATVTKSGQTGISVDGGSGVGRITQKGLDQPVGAAAINSTPRRMIAEAVAGVAEKAGYKGGLAVVIDVPEGEALAKKTFNANLGIQGGISILGTSGIVEPQSLQALIDTIEIEVRMKAEAGEKNLIFTPGNYGETFLGGYPRLAEIPQIKCSNFIGDALDFAAANRFERVLLVGHIGKLVKLAGGIMNTHSRYADCRTELFALHGGLCGATPDIMRELLTAATGDSCVEILKREGMAEQVLGGIAAAGESYLERRSGGAFAVGLVTFSNRYGLLAVSDNAQKILKEWGVKL